MEMLMKRFTALDALKQRWQYEGPREICGIPGMVTVPPSIQGDQFLPIVYNTPLPAAIATMASTALFTIPATGTYRLTLSASQTVLGVGSPGATTFTPGVTFTDPNAAGTTTVTMGAFTTGATNGAVGYIALASGLGTLVFRAKVGTAVSMVNTVSGGGGTTNPTVVIYPVFECLGQ
jgi:hypothetical protein